ncbi:Putative fungal domain of STAND protein [Colletotrichum destructivum]|uniref:Fungal domain of STAND protein n=1 Tax=Colletotrichum destructivum TaxID=34406 RepID=A0AAX4IPZ5_9PEZI|nr:Putative fungal domain of STAND protein [Colletotrichum destructivum]
MSDPLSIAASIAGLVTLADIIFDRLVKYGRSVKDAEKEIQELAKEVNLLAGILSSLSRLARALDDESFDRNLRMHHIEACNKTLAEIDKRLGKMDKDSIKDRLKWPFSNHRIKEWLEELSKHKQNINLALSANTMDAMLRLLAQEGRHAGETLTVVKETREIVTRIEQNSGRTKILDYFLKYNPQQNYEMSRRLRHPRTGLWLTRLPEFQHWLSTPDSRLWLKGIPGAGKTVLAASIIEAALGMSTETTPSAFFFCDYKEANTHKPEAILGALIYQLAIQKEEAYERLEKFYEELHPSNGLPRVASVMSLERVLKDMTKMYDHVYLIVDGLDECKELTDDVVEMLSDISEDTDNVSMALLSRDEDHIRGHLEADFVPLEIAAHKEDITEFVTSEIEERIRNRKLHINDAELKGEILHGLIDGAKGMFRWVACQLDHLGECDSDQDCRDALKSLPPTLNDSYVRILERIPRTKTKTIQLALNSIAYASPKLTIHQLRQILSVPEKGGPLNQRAVIREEAITRYCSSFVRKSNDGLYLEFSHFSVQEFLETASLPNSDLEIFRVSKQRAFSLLAIECLKFIQLENFSRASVDTGKKDDTKREQNRISTRDREFPAYEHAAGRWPIYARGEWEDARIVDLTKSLFRPSKTTSFTSWAISIVEQYELFGTTKNATSIITSFLFSPLHLAASFSLPQICSFLIQQKMDVNLAGPVGTPMQCAVQGIAASTELYGDDYLEWFQPTASEDHHEMVATAETINCLRHAGALFPSECTYPFHGQTLYEVAFDVAYKADTLFLPMTLLRFGVPLKEHDLESAAAFFIRQAEHDCVTHCASLQPFLESMDDSVAPSSLEIRLHRLVWNQAISYDLDFVRHPTTIDTRIYLTEEDLGRQAVAATKVGSLPVLRRILNDPRFEASTCVSEDGNSLLHLAMASPRGTVTSLIIKELLNAGCDVSKTNTFDEQPIHLWGPDCDYDNYTDDVTDNEARWHTTNTYYEAVKMLKDNGATCLAQDAKGRNALHVHADWPQGLKVLLEHFADDITKAMETVDRDGYTPLTQCLKDEEVDSASILVEHVSLSPEMVRCPTHILLLAASANASDLFETLFRSNIIDKTTLAPGDSPLHHLSRHATVGFVRRLKSIYPGSCSYPGDISGKTPLESYIGQCLQTYKVNRIASAVVEELSVSGPPMTTVVQRSVWQHFSQTLVEIARSSIVYASRLVKEAISEGHTLSRLGYLHAYESSASQSGIIPLLEVVSDRSVLTTSDFAPICELIHHFIDQTRYWPDIERSPHLIRLLKAAVQICDLKLGKFLLGKGVSVHQRVDGLSALEGICQNPPKHDEVKKMLSLVLDHADKSRWNETSPFNRLPLLHQLHAPGAEWIVGELVHRGADPNVRIDHGWHDPVLVWYLRTNRFQYASAILRAGADPSQTSSLGFDSALAAAAAFGSSSFLHELYDVHKGSRLINWTKTCSTTLSKCKEPIKLSGTNALHLGAVNGQIEILRFYLDHELISDVDSRAEDGCTPLHFAAIGGHTSVVEFLCARGCDVNARTAKGSSSLHLAARYHMLGVARALIDAGCRPSLDSAGMRPSFYALQSNDTRLIALFTSSESDPEQLTSDTREHDTLSERPRRMAFAAAFEDAILDNNLNRCQDLVARGCDLEIPLNSCGGCSPLIMAIEEERTAIVVWLLAEGASLTRTVSCGDPVVSAIHLIVGNPSLIEVLPQSLARYTNSEDGAWGQYSSLIHTAAASNNDKGLELLLKNLKDRSEHNEALKTLFCVAVNEPGADGLSALHWAAKTGNLKAVNLLLGSGANINALTIESRETPLHFAMLCDEDPEYLVALQLIDKGAALECRDHKGRTPILTATRHLSFLIIRALNDAKVDAAASDSKSTSLLLHAAPDLDGVHIHWDYVKIFAEFANLGHDPHALDSTGRSAFHSAICQDDFISLLLNLDIRLEDSQPFPWNIGSHQHLFWLTDCFRLFQRKYKQQALCNFLNMAPHNAWSPLCRSASLGRTVVMENLIIMGADIDAEGCSLGSALIVACITGRKESAVYLVRRGAALSYWGPNGFRSAHDAAKRNPSVLNWLLVGRFTDQRKLTPADGLGLVDEQSRGPFTWGGPVRAELVICGTMERLPKESSRKYWSRLMSEKKKWRGKVLPLSPARRTSRPSNLIPEEYVRIHRDGYEVKKE